MGATLAGIRRYPVKGLSGEDLDEVALSPGCALPGDRRFAIARGSTDINPTKPQWQPKDSFITLMRTERLTSLDTSFDQETGQFTIRRGGKPVARGKITEPIGRVVIDQFLAAFLKDTVQRVPKLVDAADKALTDSPDPVVSLVNLASVRDLERVTGGPVDPARFRANLYVEGLDAWEEMHWAGRELTAGEVGLQVVEHIQRCAATDVNPETAQRDLNLPKALMRAYGHVCMGVYAKITRAGTLRLGDALTVA